MNEFNDNTGLESIGSGYIRPDDSGSFSHIGYIRGGFRTVPSSSDIAKIHHSRLDGGQIIYTLYESQSYIISKTPASYFFAATASFSEFFFPVSDLGVGFPYAGSDDQFGTPPQAIITGSLLISGSGHLTASGISAVNLDVSNNINIEGALSFNGFTFSDGNISVLSGSNIFGTGSGNTHEFTGSLLISGGMYVGGSTTVSGSLDVLGDFLLNGVIINTSSILGDTEILVAPILLNAVGGFFLTEDTDGDTGNRPNQFTISSSQTIGTVLNGGDEVKIKWAYGGVDYSHTTHIFTIKQSSGTDFNWLTDESAGGVPQWSGMEYNTNSSMSLNTSIALSHWRSTVQSPGFDLKISSEMFKLYKVIKGIPCCDPFSDSFYSGSVVVKEDIEGDKLIMREGMEIHAPGPSRGDQLPILELKSGSVTPIKVNHHGILQLNKFDTPDTGLDFEPDAVEGGFLFRNGEMYIGRD